MIDEIDINKTLKLCVKLEKLSELYQIAKEAFSTCNTAQVRSKILSKFI